MTGERDARNIKSPFIFNSEDEGENGLGLVACDTLSPRVLSACEKRGAAPYRDEGPKGAD